MLDKEIEAITKCTESLQELDHEARVRVIKYVIERYGIITSTQNYTTTPNVETGRAVQQPTLLGPTQNDQFTEFTEAHDEDYPTLKELIIKGYPKNAPEWILCFAFFVSKYGKDTFTKDDIVAKYKESTLYTNSAQGNFTHNLNSCIKKDWFRDLNNSNYVLKPAGNAYAKEVLKGNSTSKEIKATQRKSTSKSQTETSNE